MAPNYEEIAEGKAEGSLQVSTPCNSDDALNIAGELNMLYSDV
jgi:hypothetical protein